MGDRGPGDMPWASVPLGHYWSLAVQDWGRAAVTSRMAGEYVPRRRCQLAFWLGVVIAAFLVSVGGLWVLVGQYRRGLLTGGELALLVGSYAVLVGVIAGGELADRPGIGEAGGTAVFILFMPIWFYVVQRAQRRSGAGT